LLQCIELLIQSLAMSAPAVLALILAVAIPVELWRAYRPDPAGDERWARDRGLELTPESRALVARYLRTARVLRTWGGVAGIVLPTLITLVASGRVVVLGFGTDGDSAPLAFGWIFVGYVVGAVCAELSLARPVAGARRAAGLARRDLDQYVPRLALLGQRALAGAAAAGTILVGVVPYPDSFSTPSPAALVAGAVVVLALAAGLEGLERWLVRRPQPFTSPAAVAADDAIRAQSIRSVAGAGLALLLLLCSGVSLALQASDVAALQVAMVVPAAVCFVASLFACRGIGVRAWRVRRTIGAAA
jgi:hypothetical protein